MEAAFQLTGTDAVDTQPRAPEHPETQVTSGSTVVTRFRSKRLEIATLPASSRTEPVEVTGTAPEQTIYKELSGRLVGKFSGFGGNGLPYAFKLLQHFEGSVLRLDKAHRNFTAVLRDRTNPTNPEEEGTIELDEVTDNDLALVVEGAVFYWYIGYRTENWGSKSRVSVIRFRRMPAWTKKDLEAIERRAEEWGNLFGEAT